MALDRCGGCGWRGGDADCRARFEAYLARDFSDPVYFRSHRLMVDAYSLQHPDDYCRSAKSFAEHLTGLCWIIEEEAGTAIGPEALRRWLDGTPRLKKPELPEQRGEVAIGDLPAEADGDEWASAVRRWAESVWAAYAELHPQARRWIAEARSSA